MMPIQKPTKRDLLMGVLISTSLASCFAPFPNSGYRETTEALREQMEVPGTNPIVGVEALSIQVLLTNTFVDIKSPRLIHCAALFEYEEPYPVACFGDSISSIRNSPVPPLKTPLGVWVYAGKEEDEHRYHPVDPNAELWAFEVKKSDSYGAWILETYPDSDRFDIEVVEEEGRELILSKYQTPE
ncbi:MAG: hypothetical protein AAGB19_02795 [Cyanobacteria bacterium P01_F01_bin.3]